MTEQESKGWTEQLAKGAERIHEMWTWHVANRPQEADAIRCLEQLYRLMRKCSSLLTGVISRDLDRERWRRERELLSEMEKEALHEPVIDDDNTEG